MSRLPLIRRSTAAVCVAATTALLATACGSAGGSNNSDNRGGSGTNRQAVAGVEADANTGQCGKDTRTIKDVLGNVTVKGQPKRIVALEFTYVDALVNVGLKPVGVADDGKPERILPGLRSKIGAYTSVGLRDAPNLQVIKSLKPDLILADEARDKALVPQLAKIAPTVTTPSLLANYKQILDAETLIGVAVNKCDAMKSSLAANAAAMDKLKAQVPADDRRKVMFTVASDKAVSAQTTLSFAPSVLQLIGFQSALNDTKDTTVGMTLETLVTDAPDVLFFAPSTPKTLIDQWKTNPLWKSIPAVKNHAVYAVDGNVWSKARGTLASEQIAQQAINNLFGKS